jgi:threonine aldolase
MNKAFMSDNTAPADERILKAVLEANVGFAKPYGNDEWTAKAEELVKKEFGESAKFFPVLTGTGANIISFASVMLSYQGVVCAETAHINVDECSAPQNFTGSKLISLPTDDGKLSVEDIEPCLHAIGFEHHSQPYVVSISQPTELGTVYTLDELKAISDFTKANNLILHIDGSRLANAAVALGCSMGEAVAGADIISLGGTKNGLMIGEAVVFLNDSLGEHCKYFRKQAMQLLSKMRYVSAQFIPYMEDKIWKENAKYANDMARQLSQALHKKGYEPVYSVDSNGIFVCLPDDVRERLLKDFEFYLWDAKTGMVRFMCSFATTQEDVDSLISKL